MHLKKSIPLKYAKKQIAPLPAKPRMRICHEIFAPLPPQFTRTPAINIERSLKVGGFGWGWLQCMSKHI